MMPWPLPKAVYVTGRGCVRAATSRLSTKGWLPPAGLDFAVALCRAVGLGAPRDVGEANERLERATTELLPLLRLPAAVPLTTSFGGVVLEDRLLTVAVLSRCAGPLFLRRRGPDLRRETLAREFEFLHPALEVP